jgi:hypothetical protein
VQRLHDAHRIAVEGVVLATGDGDDVVLGHAAGTSDAGAADAAHELCAGAQRHRRRIEQVIGVGVAHHDQRRPSGRVGSDGSQIRNQRLVELGAREIRVDEERQLARIELPAGDAEVRERDWLARRRLGRPR